MATHEQHLHGTVTPPIETKVDMDKDYDYYVAKYNTSNPPPPPSHPPQRNSKYQSNLGVVPMEPVMEQVPMVTPPRPQAEGSAQQKLEPEGTAAENVDGDEALLDLAQLEELHQEAERMKALGNKHMAAQEFSRAYNAYSAALQLSPVGPSSHVFLSNRSAALLSLKQYSRAATDARRAIALAPTFGKAHARLGQALYFLKDFEGAVGAYEDAVHYEPDNAITKTYLEKARSKLERQREKQARASKGEEVSVLTENSSVQATVINSVATDPNDQAAVVQTMGFRGQSNVMSKAVGGTLAQSAGASITDTLTQEDDPDFDEALRIQERANRFLANKQYKHAIEEYTAALFLVPDDYNLSPDLHLGRAHALNGSRRHESARIDANLAVKIKPTPEAFSTLAKSLFYMKDYQGAIDGFGRCKDLLPEGENLSMFDRAYLQKSEAALQEALESDSVASLQKTVDSSSSAIPKLKPPRFVPREEALGRTPSIPAMPKNWPQQTNRDHQVLQCGPEREIVFLSEALGIKLNRGPDGVVRVVDVSPAIPGSPIAREGAIEVGDVIREAAGVDLRRPITNIMWGDTVALIKMAPRPIVLVVAHELNPGLDTIAEQRKQAAANALSPTSAAEFFPSNSSGDESTRKHMDQMNAMASSLMEDSQAPSPDTEEPVDGEDGTTSPLTEGTEAERGATEEHTETQDVPSDPTSNSTTTREEQSLSEQMTTEEQNETQDVSSDPTSNQASKPEEQDLPGDGIVIGSQAPDDTQEPHGETEQGSKPNEDTPENQEVEDVTSNQPGVEQTVQASQHDESSVLGGDVFFHRQPKPEYNGWDNLRWMAHAGIRKLRYCETVSRFIQGRRTLFWSGDQYLVRTVAIYDEPNLLLILRQPESLDELREILDLPEGATIENPEHAFKLHLVVESVFDPNMCKLRLSPLTTLTSILPGVGVDDYRRRSCFELIDPIKTAILSGVQLRQGAERALTSFTDSGAFLETSACELALQKALCYAHNQNEDEHGDTDLSWKHQIILGTLHSFVVEGNQKMLDMSISAALRRSIVPGQGAAKYLDPRIVDAVDESGRSPLHYACLRRSSTAVASLVKVGANVDLRSGPTKLAPCHLSALNLDSKSLAALLASSRRAGVVDSLGRNPLYLCATEGRAIGGQHYFEALDDCLSVLESYGGSVETPLGFQHPVSYLASKWRDAELAVVLNHLNHRYPMIVPDADDKGYVGISLSAMHQYPVHACLVALRMQIQAVAKLGVEKRGELDCASMEKSVLRTLETLFNCGLEPNERLEGFLGFFEGSSELAVHRGYAPIQILIVTVVDANGLKEVLGGALYMGIMGLISNVAGFLVRNGARTTLDPPLQERPRKCPAIVVNHTAVEDSSDDSPAKALMVPEYFEPDEFVGSHRLKAAETTWNELMPIAIKMAGTFIFHTDKLAIENSEAPGGSDELSCAICWKTFGTLMNRKHRCRVSRRYVCGDCTTKRIVDGEEHRVSDGQFLLARGDDGKSGVRKLQARADFNRLASQQHTAARLDRLEAEERNSADSFGNVMGSMTKALFGDIPDKAEEATTSDSIQGLTADLNKTRDALNERGEKLNTLADKSDRLVNASQDFASMAKELNRKSQGGLFGW